MFWKRWIIPDCLYIFMVSIPLLFNSLSRCFIKPHSLICSIQSDSFYRNMLLYSILETFFVKMLYTWLIFWLSQIAFLIFSKELSKQLEKLSTSALSKSLTILVFSAWQSTQLLNSTLILKWSLRPGFTTATLVNLSLLFVINRSRVLPQMGINSKLRKH